MPMVRRLQAASVQGRTQRAQAGVDPALDQRGHRQREHHREADIAGVEERRMDGQRRVLQQRVERVALDRRVGQPQQRVGGEHHVADEEHAQAALRRHRRGLQPERQAAGASAITAP